MKLAFFGLRCVLRVDRQVKDCLNFAKKSGLWLPVPHLLNRNFNVKKVFKAVFRSKNGESYVQQWEVKGELGLPNQYNNNTICYECRPHIESPPEY